MHRAIAKSGSGIGRGLAVWVAVWLAACGDAPEPPAAAPVLRFSAIPDEQPTEQVARFRPVAEHLSRALGVPVEYVPVNQYSASVQAFVNSDVHFAWFGGLSGVQARRAVPGSRALAQGAEDPAFTSLLIAHEGTGLSPGTDFPLAARGLDFSFGSEGSTSGRLMPEHFIRERTGLAPQDFFGEVGFAGNHPATLAAVNSGAFDVGALNALVYRDAPPAERAHTVAIWETPPYADYNLTARGDLDEAFGAGFTGRLQRAFLALPPELCQRSFGRSKMIPAANADYEGIEAVALALGLTR